MKITRVFEATLASAVLFLAACGAEDNLAPGSGQTEQDGDQQDGAAQNEGYDLGGETETPSDGNDADDPQTDADAGNFSSSLACDTAFDGPETDLETYNDIYGETNYELEKLVTEFGQQWAAYDEGEQADDDFVASLEEISHSYSEITAAALAVGPPDQAAQWHANAVESWVRICLAITDAHEGVVNGDDTQLAEVEDALTTHPTLLNDLHANTMVGPGEEL